jgi:pyruvate dehydrogenase E1 component alpha subunit
MGLIGGFCHLYIGQEAVAGRAAVGADPGDSVITGYRDHGHMLACGIDPKGHHGGTDRARRRHQRGKGGSMHMFSVEHGFYGGHGIVGAQVPLGTGLAFAHKYRGDGGVCMPISAMARPIRARSMKASTWPSCGSCRSSS